MFGVQCFQTFQIVFTLLVAIGKARRQVFDRHAQRPPLLGRDARLVRRGNSRKLRTNDHALPRAGVGQVVEQIRCQADKVVAVRALRIGVIRQSPPHDDHASLTQCALHERILATLGRPGQNHAFGGTSPKKIGHGAAAAAAEPDHAVIGFGPQAREGRMCPFHRNDAGWRLAVAVQIVALGTHARFDPKLRDHGQRPAREQYAATGVCILADLGEAFAPVHGIAADGVPLVIPDNVKFAELPNVAGRIGK